MSSPAKHNAPPSTPLGAGTNRIPGPLSSARLGELANRALDSPLGSPAKRTVESPLESAAKRKKKNKKKKKSVPESPTKPVGEESGDESLVETSAPKTETRFVVPELRTKAGALRPLSSQRIIPCYECIRSIANDSFSKYPHRCYDVRHETRIGMNSQCSTCARKHVSPCTSIPPEFLHDSDAIYDEYEKEGHTKRVREMADALLERMPKEPARKKNRTTKLESDSVASPSPSREIIRVSEDDYDSVLDFMRGLKESKIPSDLRVSVRKVASDWLHSHEAEEEDEEE